MMLPGDSSRPIVPPEAWRLAIGEVTATSTGKTAPRKLDYFTIRRLSRPQGGGKAVYVIDADAQEAMCKAAGVSERPSAIPVTVIGNAIARDGRPALPESILFSEMARYSGGRRLCACGDFGPDDRGKATRRLYEDRSVGGKATKVLAGTDTITCDPARCEFAQSKACKPHVILSVGLPWMATVGATAKLKTTGWASVRAVTNSLIAIAASTDGWLHGIPLTLVLGWQNNSDGQMIPVLRFEFRGSEDKLRELAIPQQSRWLKQAETLKALQAGVVQATQLMLTDIGDAEATQAEFYPEATQYPTKPAPSQPEPAGEPEQAFTEGEFEAEAASDALFPTPPTPQEWVERMMTLGADGDGTGITKLFLRPAWREVTGEPRDVMPGPANCDPDVCDKIMAGLVRRAEAWHKAQAGGAA